MKKERREPISEKRMTEYYMNQDYQLNQSEKKAFNILRRWGWKPKRIKKSGYPDFECSNNRYVEIKQLNEQVQFTGKQMINFPELSRCGYRVFVMSIGTVGYTDVLELGSMFEIKGVDPREMMK